MTKAQEKQLKHYGYVNLSLEPLMDNLPQNIWLTPNEKHNKRIRVQFSFTRQETYWIGILSTLNESTGEVYVLHRIKKSSILDVVTGMILFLEDNKMLTPTV